MGWKKFRDHFKLEGCLVHVVEDGIAIGTWRLATLALVDPASGVVRPVDGFPDFLHEHCAALLDAPVTLIVSLLAEPDVFERSIPVYAYKDGRIVEEFCETPGWPNCTHAGELMREGSHLPSKAAAVARAKERIAISLEHRRNRVTDIAKELADAQEDLATFEVRKAYLDQEFPDVMPAQGMT